MTCPICAAPEYPPLLQETPPRIISINAVHEEAVVELPIIGADPLRFTVLGEDAERLAQLFEGIERMFRETRNALLERIEASNG